MSVCPVDVLKLIEERQSARVPFDPSRPVARGDLLQILQAVRWSPTAHNMQNFEVVVVDDRTLLDRIGACAAKRLVCWAARSSSGRGSWRAARPRCP